jgi:glutathione-independent formaldehyde dehydrogenase
VSLENLPYPTFEIEEAGRKRPCHHAVIVKIICTNICGSDLHMMRQRTGASLGMRLGHEITGEIVEKGRDVEFLQIGDWVSVPFNVACGKCINCIERNTNCCLNVNPHQPGGAYGYVNMGYWPGGQSEYALVPYADFCCLRIPKNVTIEKLLDISLLSDILPTAMNGAVQAGVTVGKSVYIAGAGPVGLCTVAACKLIGAGFIFVGDYEERRLECAAKMGAIPINLNTQRVLERVKSISGRNGVDCSVDCVGYECCGQHGRNRRSDEESAEVLNTCFEVTKFGGGVGIPGVYLPVDPGATGENKVGTYKLAFGKAWNKGLEIKGGQCPVMKYNRLLLEAILSGRLEVAKYLNATIITLEEAPQAYELMNKGEPRKYIIDPHGIITQMCRERLGTIKK